MGTKTVQMFGSRPAGPSESERLVEGEMVLRDRNAGMPVSEMCAKYGLSRATIYRRIDEAIAARIVPTVDAYREQQNALLDDLASRWHEHLALADAMVGLGKASEDVSLIERGVKVRAEALSHLLRVAERRARLNGTDAPVRVEATVTHEGGVEVSEKVSSLIDRARAARLVS